MNRTQPRPTSRPRFERLRTPIALLFVALLCSMLVGPTSAANTPSTLVKDINTTSQQNLSSYPLELTVVNNVAYFTIESFQGELQSIELWRTDGTTAGTSVVKSVLGDR